MVYLCKILKHILSLIIMEKNYKCNTCEKKYSHSSALYRHMKNENHYGKKETIIKNKCIKCNKIFNSRQSLWYHKKVCDKLNNTLVIENKLVETNIKQNEIIKENKPDNKEFNKLVDIITEKNIIINTLIKENNEIKKNTPEINNNIIIDKNEDYINVLQKDIEIKDQKIKVLQNMCLKKQKINIIKTKNVIYLVTSTDNKNKRIYIVGKSINLSKRMSVYNKTTEHEIIYYRSCETEEDMNVAEFLVLNKMKNYKEQMNRDRFILPIDKDIQFFINLINESIDFINK